MRRNGRAQDDHFEPTEKLFRRYIQVHYMNGQFSNTGFPFPKQSVNRQKYSEATDVLFDEAERFVGWGVLSFKVDDLPASFPPEAPRYTFFPKHEPLEDNYAHSVVWCDRVPGTRQYVEPSPQVKKLFRASLSQRVVIEIVASA
jgi:hypothetical protein